MCASVYGDVNTKAEELESSIKHFQILQDKYNTENESI